MPLDFQFREPPLLSEFQKATPGLGMDIFWNHPLHLNIIGDKLCLQSWVFDLFIVFRNFTPNITMAIS